MSVETDSDSDGVLDVDDPAPCDGRTTARAFVPAEGVYGQLMFEDLWPTKGDFDFNDLVVAYNVVVNLNSRSIPTSLVVDLDLLALGAAFRNGLAFRLPGAVSVDSASLTIDGVSQSLTPWAGEASVVLTLAADLHSLFGVGPVFVNTDPAVAFRSPVHLRLEIAISPEQDVRLADARSIFSYSTLSEVRRCTGPITKVRRA